MFRFSPQMVSETQAVPLQLSPELLISICILLVHMAFICNWFVSAPVNAIHPFADALSRSLSLCLPCFPSGFPSNKKRFKGSTESHSFSLYLDNWNKCPFESKSVCLIYRKCNSKAFLEARALHHCAPFTSVNNVAALRGCLKREENIMLQTILVSWGVKYK